MRGAPLLPLRGVLPREGGDWVARLLSPILDVGALLKEKARTDLPPRGGERRAAARGGALGTNLTGGVILAQGRADAP